MKILYPTSLAATVDAINDALFFARPLKQSQKREAVKWIAGRVAADSPYVGMPAPTKKDFTQGVKLFTGEALKGRAITAHILGEEAVGPCSC